MPPLKFQKQEIFCLEYIKTGNASNAAIVAGYAPKYAAQNTNKLLKNTNIISRIAELQEKTEKKSLKILNPESKTIASVIERKEILSEIARAKLTDFMELGQDGSWVNIGPETKSGHAIQEIHSRTEYDKDGASPTIYTSVKLHDPIKAICELNKMERVYDDAPKINVNIDQRQLNIYDLSSLSDQELDTLEQITRKVTPLISADSSGTETP
jgi:phage terminase small subunit